MIMMDFIFYCFYRVINKSNLYRDSPVFYSSLFMSVIGIFPSIILLFEVFVFNVFGLDFANNKLGVTLLISNILLFSWIYYRYKQVVNLEYVSMKFHVFEKKKYRHIISFITIISYYIVGASLFLLIPIIKTWFI